jgi:hypothetical protein
MVKNNSYDYSMLVCKKSSLTGKKITHPERGIKNAGIIWFRFVVSLARYGWGASQAFGCYGSISLAR